MLDLHACSARTRMPGRRRFTAAADAYLTIHSSAYLPSRAGEGIGPVGQKYCFGGALSTQKCTVCVVIGLNLI
jgi:hypothetical protein